MRILLVGITYPPQLNGQAVFTQSLAEGLVECGHEVVVLTPEDRRAGAHIAHAGVKIVHTPAWRLAWLHPDLLIPRTILSVVQRTFNDFQPHLVHCQDPSPLSQVAVRAARKRRLPVMATHHTGPAVTAPYLRLPQAQAQQLAETLTWHGLIASLNQMDLVTVPSQFSVTMLQAHGLRVPVQAIPCGIALDAFQFDPALDRQAIRRRFGLTTGNPLLLYVGRLDKEKNVEVLLRGLALLQPAPLTLVLAGRGAQETEIKHLAGALGIRDRVHFLGQVEHADLPALYNAADMFVMPGRFESFSIATLEAMSCGLPVLAAQAGALPEWVSPGVNGYLFQPDSPADVARYMAQLLADADRWAVMGAASAARAQRFSLDGMALAYQQVYEELYAKPVATHHVARQWRLLNLIP